MKRGFSLLTFLLLFLTNFVSAQFFDRYGYGYGGYGSISLTEIFDRLDPTTVFYVLLFFILFTVLTLALSRANLFRDHYGKPNSTAAGVVAFSIATMVVYYLYRTGYNAESFFYDLGFSGDSLSLLVVIILLVAAFLIIRKSGFSGFFIISGLLLMLIAIFTNLIYEKRTIGFVGAALFIIGILFWKKVREHTKDIRTQ